MFENDDSGNLVYLRFIAFTSLVFFKVTINLAQFKRGSPQRRANLQTAGERYRQSQ